MKLFFHLAFMLFALSVYSQTAVVISENANLRGTLSEMEGLVERNIAEEDDICLPIGRRN